MDALATTLEALEREALDALRADFRAYNELVWRTRLLPAEIVDTLADEAVALRARAHRARIPGYKKSGSVSSWDLRAHAPGITALYEDPRFVALLESIAGTRFLPCPEDDPHAFGLYYYTEPGDRIGFHYDSSHYAGARYTVLVGLVNRSKSELVCRPFEKTGGPSIELRIATEPGTLVFFNGENIKHCVSPVGDGEERIVLTLEYVTDSRMSPVRRAISNVKDALTYFGLRALLRGKEPREQRAVRAERRSAPR